MAAAADFIHNGLAERSLTVAQDKTFVTATHPQAAESLKRKLSDRGLAFNDAVTAKDLGIGVTTGRRRTTVVAVSRLRKCHKRMVKAKQLNKWSKGKASRMFTGSLYPARTYGVEAAGFSHAALRNLRSSAAALSPHSCNGSCTTTCIAIGYRDGWDPAVRVRRQI